MSGFGYVVGNGPSLRGFDLRRLDPERTVGMNAAYRHWREIDWFPGFYCCLDDQMIETHHAEIDRLYTEGHVRDFFLNGRFFELHPERIGNPAFLSLDQVTAHWHAVRGAASGLSFIDHPAFRTAQSDKLTTGSYAVRFMAYQGFDRIALLGIDLRYVEILPEARRTEGIGLIMAETPAANPNYFFDGYQQAGDRFNIPNPDVHNNELHLKSFELVHDDFIANGVLSEVVNTNPTSLLEEERIFPLANIDEVLSDPTENAPPVLGAVVVPCTQADVDQIVANFHFWSDPAYAPYDGQEPDTKPTLLLVFNNSGAAQDAARAKNAFERLRVRNAFNGLVISFLELEGARDAYVRGHESFDPEHGHKAGPNNLFFGAMAIAREFGRYSFLMEADCVPIRAGWLGRLQSIVSTPDLFWVTGSAYRGKGTLGRTIGQHINGNAIYASGDRSFQLFLSRVWEPKLQEFIRDRDPRAAYDITLDYMREDMRSERPGNVGWDFWRHHAHLFRYTDFVVNVSGDRDIWEPDPQIVRRAQCSKTTFLVHSASLARAVLNSWKEGGAVPKPIELVPVPTGKPSVQLGKEAQSSLPSFEWPPSNVRFESFPIEVPVGALSYRWRGRLRKVFFALPSPVQRLISRLLRPA